MRFSVGKKIGGGFGVVVLLLLVVFIYTFTVVNDAIKSNDKFLNVDQPSLFAINKLKDDLATTHSHMQKWANDESAKQPDWPFKLDAALLLDSVLFSDYSSILKLSESWLENDTGKVKIILIKQQLDLLIADYNDNIRFILRSMESYDMFFIAQTQFETSTNESFNELYDEISTLAQNRGKIAKLQQQETNQSFSQLINSIIFIGIIF